MATRTASELLADIRWQADIENLTNRYSDTQLLRLVNQAFRDVRQLLFVHSAPCVVATVEATHGGSTGASSGWAGTLLDLSAESIPGIAAVERLAAQVEGEWVDLTPISITQASDWSRAHGFGESGPPENYAIVGVEAEQAASADGTQLQILILPAMDQLYSFQLSYLGEWEDITTTPSDTVIPADAPICQWVKWEVMRLVKLRDNLIQDAQIATSERDRAYDAMRRFYAASIGKVAMQRSPIRRRSMSRKWWDR